MREVVFTVSPKRQYLGIACPTTPVYAIQCGTLTFNTLNEQKDWKIGVKTLRCR